MKFYPLQLQLTCLGYLVCPDPNKNHSIGVALSKGAKISTKKVTVEGNIANIQLVSSWLYLQTLQFVWKRVNSDKQSSLFVRSISDEDKKKVL
jgi:hypothetical protein